MLLVVGSTKLYDYFYYTRVMSVEKSCNININRAFSRAHSAPNKVISGLFTFNLILSNKVLCT